MKERLDLIVVNRGLAPSREKAKALIMSGCVYVNGQKELKSGDLFDTETSEVEVKGNTLKYVSRGGLKLEKAFKVFPLDVNAKCCIDIGSSTGGFTDCLLQNGASKVYAIDVGYGQLDWKLRNDERVIVMEKTNFRYVTPEDINDDVSFACCDVAFISLTRILKNAYDILNSSGQMVCLIKPQFEAGKEKVGKKGVVKDPGVHLEVIESIVNFAHETGFFITGLSGSPIRGPEGNIEYLLYLTKDPEKDGFEDILKHAEDEVKRTHEEFLRNNQ